MQGFAEEKIDRQKNKSSGEIRLFHRPHLKACLLLLLLLLLSATLPIDSQGQNKLEPTRFVKEYQLENRANNAFAIASDQIGNIWFSERNLSSIAMLDPRSGTIREYKVPSTSDRLEIWSIAIDSNGNIWFGDATENKIRMFDPGGLKFFEYVIPTPDAQPWDVKVDSKGNVWFTEFGSGKLGRLETAMARNATSEGFREFPNFTRPSNILFDKSGLLWVLDSGPAKLVSFDTVLEKFTEYRLPRTENSTTNPIGIALDSGGKIWYTQFRTSNIGRFDPKTGSVEQFATGVLTGATYGITSDKDGNIWTVQQRVDRIVKISPQSMTLSEFQIPTNQSLTQSITADPFGNIWFIERSGNKLGVIEAGVQAPIRVTLPSNRFTISPNGMLKILVSLESSETGSFFPILRGSMTATGNVANMSISFAPDLIQLDSLGKVTSEMTISSRNLKPGSYKMVVGFTDPVLTVYQGVFFDLIVERGEVEFLQPIVIVIVVAIVIVILGVAIYFTLLRAKPRPRPGPLSPAATSDIPSSYSSLSRPTIIHKITLLSDLH